MRTSLLSFACVFACAAPAPRPEVVAIVGDRIDASSESPQDAGSYSENAKDRFERAEDLVRARDLDEARAQLVSLKTTFAYSKYAALAELRIADIDYANRSYTTAANEYSSFAHDHPTHASAPVALLRAATARCLAKDAGACNDNYDSGL